MNKINTNLSEWEQNKPQEAAPVVIQLNNVDINQRQTAVLRDVQLQVRKGEFVYLVGRTGSGKSSLLKTLYGELPLQKGEGTVAGFNLKMLDWRTVPYLRRKLGIIFQDFQLLMDRNVEDNLRFALESTDWRDNNEINKRIGNVLAAVNISHKRHTMPYLLSGGEQQRVVVARALLNDPPIILADEPTGNLDPQTSFEIFNLLHQICKETATTIVVGTHDFYTIKHFPARMITCQDQQLLKGNFMDLKMGQ